MRFLVVGAGGIGGYFGGRMLQAGADVTFLVRPRRDAQLAADGLVIRSPRGDATLANPPRVTADRLDGTYDAVLLSCKAFDLEDAVAAFAPAVGPQTRIVPLLNGMAHLDTLSARFGADTVLGGLVLISSTLEPGGTIRHFGDLQSLVVGDRQGRPDAVADAVAQAASSAGGRVSGAILQEMWEKWVFICTLASATGMLRGTVGDILAAGAEEIPLGLARECAAVAEAHGYAPRPDASARLNAVITTKNSPLTASLLRDLEHGSRIEAEQIVGDMLSRARGASPLLRAALLHLRTYEARRARQAG